MRCTLFLFILFVFLGCNDKRVVVDKYLINNFIKSNKLTSFEKVLIDTMIFENFSIVPLETNDEGLITKIDRIAISNGRIYIFDSNMEKVCIFDDKGKYINQIHRIGQGPEEYLAIIDFCLDEKNKEILLLCDRPYKLMKFSLDGDFIREISYSDFYGEISTNSDNLFCLLNEVKDEFEIGCFDKELKLTNKGLATREKINKECYDVGKSLVKSKNLIYTRRFDPSIYYISKNSIEKRYEFDFGKYRFPQDLAYEEDCNELFEICRRNEYIYSITNAIESDEYIFFSTNIGICLYEKETNKLSGYKILLNQSMNSGSNIFYPNEGNGSSIITSLDPSLLSYYGEETIRDSPLLSDLVKKVKRDDNPILIIYEFKD